MSDRWDPRPRGRGPSRSAAPPPPAPRPPSARPGAQRGPSRWGTGSFSRGSGRGGGAPAGSRPGPAGPFAVGPGLPWPVVAVGAVVVTGVLAWLLLHRAGLLGLMFPIGYLVVCMLGVAMVRPEGVAVPALSPPVVAFLGLAIAAVVAGDAASSTLFLLGVFAPLAELFWWMIVATVACLVVGFLRFRAARPGWSPAALFRRPGTA